MDPQILREAWSGSLGWTQAPLSGPACWSPPQNYGLQFPHCPPAPCSGHRSGYKSSRVCKMPFPSLPTRVILRLTAEFSFSRKPFLTFLSRRKCYFLSAPSVTFSDFYNSSNYIPMNVNISVYST